MKRLLGWSCFVFSWTLVGACTNNTPEEAPSCFTVGYLDITASAPLRIADDLGLFENHGVCITGEVLDTSNALVDAFDDAFRLMRTDPTRVRELLATHFALPDDSVQVLHLPYMAPHDEVSTTSLEDYADLLVEVGELSVRPNIDGILWVDPTP